MGQYSISDLQQMSGIKAHTIRMWERRYNILEPKRTKTNIRYYEDEDLRKLLAVRYLNDNGHRISEISKMCNLTLQSKVKEILHSTENIEGQHRFDGLTLAMLELDESKFETIFSGYCREKGFGFTLAEVIFPFLDELAVLWEEGVVHAGHENFIINFIKRKLYNAIENLPIPNDDAPRFLIFRPSHEDVDLALLYMEFVSKKMGFKCINLGPIDDFEHLSKINDRFNPDHVFSILNIAQSDSSASIYINEKLNIFNNSNIYMIGFSAYNADLQPNNRLFVCRDLSECIDQFREKVKG